MSGVDLAAILAFVNARLDEDEREATWAAEEAGGAAWTIRSTDVVLADDTDRYVSGNAQNEVRDHIARHDPARVLREVEAKRRIVELYEYAVASWNLDRTALVHLGQRAIAEAALQALAAPFASHPDFDPAWAVEA